MTKKLLSTIFILFFISSIYAQEQPYAKLYIFDQTLLNPAVGAKYDYLSIKFTGSEQWINLPKNPQIQNLSINSKFKNKKMGINTTFMNNSYGVINYTGLKLSYFYYTKLNVQGDYLSYGIYGTIFQLNFDTRNLISSVQDPVLTNQLYSTFYPNAGLGIYYKQKYFSLGLSAGNLLPYKPKFINNSYEPSKAPTIFLYADSRIANEIKTFIYEPSAMFFIDKNLKRELDLNSRFIFNNKFWFGISYRDALNLDNYAIHNILLMLGIRFFNRLHFAYSYDIDVLSARSVLGGSHSLMLGFDFIHNRRIYPMYF